MRVFIKKFLPLFLAVFILIAIFFAGFAQASFWDIIKAWVTINPLEVNLSAPVEVEVDKVFKVEAKAINKGEEKIENAKGEIFLPSGLTPLKKDPVKQVGVIPGKKEKKISWSVRGEEVGNYIIAVSVSGELKGGLVSAEDSTKVEVKESLKKTQPMNWFQNFLNLFRKWLEGG